MAQTIDITGARVHNLKRVDVQTPSVNHCGAGPSYELTCATVFVLCGLPCVSPYPTTTTPTGFAPSASRCTVLRLNVPPTHHVLSPSVCAYSMRSAPAYPKRSSVPSGPAMMKKLLTSFANSSLIDAKRWLSSRVLATLLFWIIRSSSARRSRGFWLAGASRQHTALPDCMEPCEYGYE